MKKFDIITKKDIIKKIFCKCRSNTETDAINPAYYSKDGTQYIDKVSEHGNDALFWFCFLNAGKYLYRCGNKEGNPELQDLNKAEWYINYIYEHIPNEFIAQEMHHELRMYVQEIEKRKSSIS